MTRLALCLLLLATGANAEQLTKNVEVIHDDRHAVTCWLFEGTYKGGGISCIPDSHLAGEQRTQNLADDQFDNTPTPAQKPARRNEERYSL